MAENPYELIGSARAAQLLGTTDSVLCRWEKLDPPLGLAVSLSPLRFRRGDVVAIQRVPLLTGSLTLERMSTLAEIPLDDLTKWVSQGLLPVTRRTGSGNLCTGIAVRRVLLARNRQRQPLQPTTT